MPGRRPTNWKCVYCGATFSHYGSYHYHEPRCNQRPDAPEPQEIDFECPNCGDHRGNPNAMRLHIDAQHNPSSFKVRPSAVRAFIERLEQELAFALWCSENGRIYEA